MIESEENRVEDKSSDSGREDEKLIVPEDRALALARANPNEALPILVTYGFNDKDNPRCWPKWKKWWISFFVSMLNVITYVPATSVVGLLSHDML